MKGFGKQLIAGLVVALFIATATYFVIYTAGFAYSDQMEVTAAEKHSSDSPLTPPPISPSPTPMLPVRTCATPYPTLQSAYDNYYDPAEISAIEMLAGDLPGSLDAYRPIDITLKGGFDTTWTPSSGITIIQGEITISHGSLTVEKVVISNQPTQ
jgi:hypothetical protein